MRRRRRDRTTPALRLFDREDDEPMDEPLDPGDPAGFWEHQDVRPQGQQHGA